MTDRELLEAAAKAAGIALLDWRETWADYAGPAWRTTGRELWNPLTDDGDCARLEAALMLHVEWHPATETVYVGTAELGCTKPWGADRQSARRAAAVRAAAAMARA